MRASGSSASTAACAPSPGRSPQRGSGTGRDRPRALRSRLLQGSRARRYRSRWSPPPGRGRRLPPGPPRDRTGAAGGRSRPIGNAARSRRRPRPGAWAKGPRARCRRCAQPPTRRAAGHGQDDARAPPAVDPPALDPGRGPRGDAHPLGRRHAAARSRASVAPPFRAPHHGASTAAIIGGGVTPRPGEVSLAHRGVLLLDELPEYPRSVLEALRQPLEDGVVSVARVGGRALFPARFRLVATMNLCPCGGRGDPRLECVCAPARIAAYRDKVSRALLDRFDLVVAMPRPAAHDLAAGPSEASLRRAGAGRGRRAPPGVLATAPDVGCVGAPRQGGRPASAHGSRPGPRCPGRAHHRGPRRVGGHPARARGGGSLVSRHRRA